MLSNDIPECLECSAEKLCTKCEFGKVLIGPSLEYTGRCICPDGLYKFGFTTTACTKNEYIREDWEKYKVSIENLTTIDDVFLN